MIFGYLGRILFGGGKPGTPVESPVEKEFAGWDGGPSVDENMVEDEELLLLIVAAFMEIVD